MREFTRDWTRELVESLKTLDVEMQSVKAYLELGVFEGRGACHVLDTYQHITYTGVDSWELLEASTKLITKKDVEAVERRAMSNLDHFMSSGRATVIKKRNDDALMKFLRRKKKFDMIYIDGSHFKFDVLLESMLA